MAITRRVRGGGRGSGREESYGRHGDENPNIDQQVAALIPIIVTQVTSAMASRYESGANGDSAGDNNQDGSDCTYKEFTASKSKEFDGIGGAVAYTRWMEKMEAVIDISDCPANKRVRYVTGSLTDQALTLWNTQIQAKKGRKKHRGPHPKCDRCNYHHQASIPCRVCARCNRLGHFAKSCRIEIKHVTPLNVIYPETYYECGSPDHYQSAYPRPKRAPSQDRSNPNQILTIEGNKTNQDNNENLALSQVFAIAVNEARQDPDIATSTSSLNEQ